MGKKLKWTLIVIMILLLIGVIIYNIIKNTNFFQASIIEIITLLVAIFLSYVFTEKNSNERRLKEALEVIIEKTQMKLNMNVLVKINNEEDLRQVRIIKRSLENNFTLLKENSECFKIKEDIEYIIQQLENYNSIIDNHINDIEHLSNAEVDLNRYILLIDDKLNQVRVKLYK